MSTKKTSHVTMLRFLRVSIPLALMMFSLNVPTVFGAALCVTNPYGWPDNYVDQRCEVNLQVIPSSSTIPSGGSTDITLKALGILQYDVYLIDFSAWMVEDGTGVTTDLSYAGSEPEFAGSRIANTGALTKSVTVYLYGLNTQGKSKSVSAHITVTPSTSCVAGWSEEELTFDGTPNSGTGWCNNTSYGACASGTITGSHDPSAKGSISACCRGAGTLGYLRNCGSPPPPSTVTPTSCGAYGGVNDAGTTGACRFNLNVGITPSGGSYTSTSIYSPSGYTGSYTWSCSNTVWSPGAWTCVAPSSTCTDTTASNYGGAQSCTYACTASTLPSGGIPWNSTAPSSSDWVTYVYHATNPGPSVACTYHYASSSDSDGSCNTIHYNCLSSTPSTNNVNGTSSYTWTCPGTGTGTLASCSESKSTCKADYPYPETRPDAIASYCAGTGVTCPAGQQYVSSISCHSGTNTSGQVDWSPYGNSCTAPHCTGCGCVPGSAIDPSLAPCTAVGLHTWGIGCSQYLNETVPSGTVVTDTNTAQGYKGEEKYRCTNGDWGAPLSASCTATPNTPVVTPGVTPVVTPGVTPVVIPTPAPLINGCGAGTLNNTCCASSYPGPCSATSSANSCGSANTNTGSYRCDGSCNASTPNAPPDPAVTATISATPIRVKVGGTTTVTWATTGANNCTITKNNVSWKILSSASCSLSSSASDTVTTQTTYGILCTGGAGTASAKSNIVNVVPLYQEF